MSSRMWNTLQNEGAKTGNDVQIVFLFNLNNNEERSINYYY